MAAPSTQCEALRDVAIANGFVQSTKPNGYDSEDPGRIHKQFYITGPTLRDTEDVSQVIHELWELEFHVAHTPRVGGADPDKGQFEAADSLQDLHAAWHEDAVLKGDQFGIQAAEVVWLEVPPVWEALITAAFITARQVTV